MAPKAGSRFTFKGVPDDDGNLTAYGNEPGAVKIGTEVEVRESVEDAVVVEWDEPSLSTDDEGNPVVGKARRAWSVGSDDFNTMFSRKGS